MTLHLEGMGVVGSILAFHLDRAGVDFTWNDIDAPFTAWKASTGAVYPSGDSTDEACRMLWLDWQKNAIPAVEVAPFVYSSINQPHGGKYDFTESIGGLRIAMTPSVHVNAQKFVAWARAYFASRGGRNTKSLFEDVRIVTHGWSSRHKDSVWGWHVPVLITRQDMSLPERAAYYFREGRFVEAYAFPMPGTDLWYAGSSRVVQKQEHTLDPEKHWINWLRNFDRMSGGALKVYRAGNAVQGWRPRGRENEFEPMLLSRVMGDDENVSHAKRGIHIIAPQGGNGIRHAPAYVASVKAILGVK